MIFKRFKQFLNTPVKELITGNEIKFISKQPPIKSIRSELDNIEKWMNKLISQESFYIPPQSNLDLYGFNGSSKYEDYEGNKITRINDAYIYRNNQRADLKFNLKILIGVVWSNQHYFHHFADDLDGEYTEINSYKELPPPEFAYSFTLRENGNWNEQNIPWTKNYSKFEKQLIKFDEKIEDGSLDYEEYESLVEELKEKYPQEPIDKFIIKNFSEPFFINPPKDRDGKYKHWDSVKGTRKLLKSFDQLKDYFEKDMKKTSTYLEKYNMKFSDVFDDTHQTNIEHKKNMEDFVKRPTKFFLNYDPNIKQNYSELGNVDLPLDEDNENAYHGTIMWW